MRTKTLFQVSRLFNVSGYTIYQWCLDCKLVEHKGIGLQLKFMKNYLSEVSK